MEQPNTNNLESQLKIGCEATEIVLALPRVQTSLEALTFNIYAPYPGLEERVAQSADQTMNTPEATEIPRLESEILAASNNQEQFRLFIQEAIRHDSALELNNRIELAAGSLSRELLVAQLARLPGDAVLALCSRCRLRDGSTKHIPMMDFRCSPSPENLARVRAIVNGLGQKNGAILESGRSYHYYGFELFDENEWKEFLAQCLLLHPFTDSRYIAHRLMADTCALRISANRLKPKVPFVVGLV